MSEEIWVTLEQSMIDFVDKISDQQTMARINSGARQASGGPEGEASIPLRLKQGRDGLRAEAAARLYFGTVIPWSVLSDKWGTPDFSDFIDVKSRMVLHYGCKIKPGNDPQRAYLLCCGVEHPRWRIVGWVWGHEIRTDDRWMHFGTSGKPCWVVNEDDPLMKNPEELKALALAKVKRSA